MEVDYLTKIIIGLIRLRKGITFWEIKRILSNKHHIEMDKASLLRRLKKYGNE